MKAIMISVSPMDLTCVLNKQTNFIVRNTFPKDYVGWVYLYCNQNECELFETEYTECPYQIAPLGKTTTYLLPLRHLNGKVVARVWVDASEKFGKDDFSGFINSLSIPSYVKEKVLRLHEQGIVSHISKLEIFSDYKNITDFRKENPSKNKHLARTLSICIPKTYTWVDIEDGSND